MKGWSALSSGIKLILGLGAALFIAIVALGLLGPGGGTPTEIAAEPASTDAPDAVADTSEPADDVGDDQGISDDAAPADTADATATTPSEDDVSTGPAPPRFDIVRVDADGNALIAGRAAPGSLIAFLLDGIVFAEEDADQAGNFVAITIIPLTDAPQSLSIRMSTSDDLVVHSEQTVIIAPAATSEPVVVAEAAPQASDEPSSDTSAAITISPSEPEEAPAQVASTEPADDPPSSDDAGAAGDAGSDLLQDPGGLEVASLSEAPEGDDAPSVAADATSSDALDAASTTENSTSTASVAPSVVLADDEGVTVLQPSGGAPSVLDAIVLDSIAYDATGDVTLSGRGTGTGFVRVYLNNAPVGTLRIEADGRWRAPLPEVDTGIYTLRIDEIDEAGNVISRVETPFKREEPSVLAAAIEAGRDKDVSVVTVQKGNTLWGISRKNYGRGILYVHVFEANRDQIQNPHLIYPGQVFTIPDNPEPVADR